MSTSASSRPPTSPSPTRQQLDELDALLERMLALPVNKLDEGAEPAEEPSPGAASRQARERMKREEPQPTPPAAPALRMVQEPVSAAPQPPVERREARGEERVVPPARSAPVLAHPTSAARSPERAIRTPERTDHARSSLWLWPLLLINGAFYACSDRLGAPGRWLRRPRGRTFVGVIGLLLLLAAALLLVFDRIAWTW